MTTHKFGGNWTERKLNALRDYLINYQKIFHTNEAAKNLRTVYVDAFAGTGERKGQPFNESIGLFGYGDETREFQEGSVKVALAIENKFHRYVFIDSKPAHMKALKGLISKEFPSLLERCETINADANDWLTDWCAKQDWRKQRAVVFLDPYGMSVAWKTIETIAKTQSIDLWVLFPFAIGANRMMPNDMLPETEWGKLLTRVFGTADWVHQFYKRDVSTDLFGDTNNSVVKIAGADEILEFFLRRLRDVFPYVVDKPLILQNSNKSPMYALCFAAGNPKGGKTALKIAAHLARTR